MILYKPDRFGDFILALETIRKLINRYGSNETLLVVSPQGRSMAEQFFPDVAVLCLESGCDVRKFSQLPQLLREFRRLACLKAGALVSLKHHKREIDFIYERAIHAEVTYTIRGDFSVKRLSTLVNPSIPYPERPMPGICREIIAHHDLWQHITGGQDEPGSFAPSYRDASGASSGGPTIVSPFGSKYLRDIRAEQVYRFLPEEGSDILVIGSRDQMQKLETFTHDLEALGAVNVSAVVFSSIEAYLNAIRDAGFVISTETATAHFAIAFDRPGVGFLGGGHFGYFAPWGTGRFKWLYKEMDCYNCDWQCCHEKVLCLAEL